MGISNLAKRDEIERTIRIKIEAVRIGDGRNDEGLFFRQVIDIWFFREKYIHNTDIVRGFFLGGKENGKRAVRADDLTVT